MLSVLAAIITGIILPIQGAINSQIGKLSGQFIMIIGVSVFQILFALLFVLYNQQKISDTISTKALISGMMGICAMYGFSYSIANIGTLKVFALVLAAQIITAAVVDHFGLVGVEVSPITYNKVGSCILILTGVYWLARS
ncbi:MAG: DMT family transporter [Sporomusaceae bacterium]|nr:DMT family transporter [Sporomusaceae bacterium]